MLKQQDFFKQSEQNKDNQHPYVWRQVQIQAWTVQWGRKKIWNAHHTKSLNGGCKKMVLWNHSLAMSTLAEQEIELKYQMADLQEKGFL